MSKNWFRRRGGLLSKDLGWGYVPISWEGWLMVIGLIGLLLLSVWINDIGNPLTTMRSGMKFVFDLALVMLAFVAFAEHKTE